VKEQLQGWLWSQWDDRRPVVLGYVSGVTLCLLVVAFSLTDEGDMSNQASGHHVFHRLSVVPANTTTTTPPTTTTTSPSQTSAGSIAPSTSDTTPLGTAAHLPVSSAVSQSRAVTNPAGTSSQLTVRPSGSLSNGKVQNDHAAGHLTVALHTVLTCVDQSAPLDASEGYSVHVTVTQGNSEAYGETTGLCHNHAQRKNMITLGVTSGLLTQGAASVEADARNGRGNVTASFGPMNINLECPLPGC